MHKWIRAIIIGGLWLILFGNCGAANPTITAEIGFSGFHAASQSALVKVTLSGVTPFFSGSLVLRQIIGNPWIGEGTMERRLVITAGISGIYSRQTAIVLHRSNHLFEIILYDDMENPVASWQHDLRPFLREERFPLIVGDIAVDVNDKDPIFLAAGALPSDWRAYGSISSLLIGRLTPPLLNRAQWAAIAQWIYTGGRLVLFTGSDFFLHDAPILRALLPLESPIVTTDTAGLTILTGELRNNALVKLRDGDWPLFITTRHGNGELLLITRRSFDLSLQQRAALVPLLIVAPRPAPDIRLTADQLAQMIIERPSRWAALAIVGAILISFSLITLYMRQRRLVLPSLLGTTIIIAVLSGLYSNRLAFLLDVYVNRISFNVQVLYGFSVISYGLFTPNSTNISLKVRDNDQIHFVLDRRPPSLVRRDDDQVVITMRDGERCYLVVERIRSIPIKFQQNSDAAITVTNDLPRSLRRAFLIKDGRAYPLQAIMPGTSIVTYGNKMGTSLAAAIAAYWPKDLQRLFKKVDVDITTGTWLIGYAVSEQFERWEAISAKVRDIALYLVQQRGT